MTTDVMTFKFPTLTGADEMVEILKDLQKKDLIEVQDAVVAIKYDEQHIDVRQRLGSHPGKATAAAALVGTLLGIAAGPVGAAVGFAAGAAVGGIADAAHEPGSQSEELKSGSRYELKPGESVLMVYTDPLWSAQVEQAAKEMNVRLYRRSSVQVAATPEGIEIRKETLVAAYSSWERELEHGRDELATLRQFASTAAQAEQARIQEQIATAKAKLDQLYQNMRQTLDARRQELDAEITRLEAEAKQSLAQRKAEIDQRLTAAREARTTLQAQVKATLSARLDDLKVDVANLKSQVEKNGNEARTTWQGRIAALEAGWQSEEKRLEQLDTTQGAAWNEMSHSVGQAIDTYRESVRQAEEEYRNRATVAAPKAVESVNHS